MRILAYKPDSFSLEMQIRLIRRTDPDDFIMKMSNLADVKKIDVLDWGQSATRPGLTPEHKQNQPMMNAFCSLLVGFAYAVGVRVVRAHFHYIMAYKAKVS